MQDGHGKAAVEAVHPPPVEPQHVGSGKAIRDVEGLAMLRHPSEAPVPIAEGSARDTLPKLGIRTGLEGQCARAFICHPDGDIRDTQQRRRGVADGREDLRQIERCRELPGEVDQSFQDECWLNPLNMTCPDDRAWRQRSNSLHATHRLLRKMRKECSRKESDGLWRTLPNRRKILRSQHVIIPRFHYAVAFTRGQC